MTVATIQGAEVELRRPVGALALSETQTAWLPEQRAALDQLGLAGADEGNLAVFLHVSQRTGLDPFARQIYMIGRNSKESTRNPDGSWSERWVTKYTIQTGIGGYRTLARRAARRDGSSYGYGGPNGEPAAEWCDRGGRWHDSWISEDPPAAARFTITKTDRHGRVEKFTGTCRWGAYAQYKNGKLQGRWAFAGDQMLSKCSEALALQMAYPQDYSGVEYEGAMDHLDSEPRTIGPPSTRDRMSATASGAAAPMDLGAWFQKIAAAIVAAESADDLNKVAADIATGEGAGLAGPEDLAALRDAMRARAGELPAGQTALRRMHAALTALNLDPDQRKLAAGNVVGRVISSTSDLTGAEAHTVWRRAAAAAQDGGAASLLYPPDGPNHDPETGEILPDDAGVDPADYADADPVAGTSQLADASEGGA